MGMDVVGIHPISEKGEYFRNNIWWWHPLWEYCEAVAPDIIPEDNLAHSNDGWGLNAEDAQRLAQRLKEELEAGRTEAFEKKLIHAQNQISDEVCDLCNGTGKRMWPEGEKVCNGCDGAGTRRPLATWYRFSAENVKEFAEFLQDCGGFEIW